MAPNVKKMKAFGNKGSPQPAGEDDLETGLNKPDVANGYSNIDVAIPSKGAGGATEEYSS